MRQYAQGKKKVHYYNLEQNYVKLEVKFLQLTCFSK